MATENSRDFDAESRDRLLSTLSVACSRGVLAYFRQSDERLAALDDVAAFVVDHRVDGDVGTERVAVQLHHASLPKLADVGVLEYDARSQTVRCDDHPVVEHGTARALGLADD